MTEAWLRAYDEHLRVSAPSAVALTRLGPLVLVTFDGGRGWITYRDLGGADADEVRDLVTGALEHYRQDPTITRVTWKTRGHDHAPGLQDTLLEHGFIAQETDSVMIGDATGLSGKVPPPDGVTLRQVVDEADVRAMTAMESIVFDDDQAEAYAASLLRRLALDDGMELWVAEAEGRIVAAGRVEPVAGTPFAGLWGGATLREWRGRGIYGALTAVRARVAVRHGHSLIHSDSSEFSRPILERSGLVRVTTTTPYVWTRSPQE